MCVVVLHKCFIALHDLNQYAMDFRRSTCIFCQTRVKLHCNLDGAALDNASDHFKNEDMSIYDEYCGVLLYGDTSFFGMISTKYAVDFLHFTCIFFEPEYSYIAI